MVIKFMQLLQRNKKIDDRENSGISEGAIEQIESVIDRKFPASYKEYLFLAGQESVAIFEESSTMFISENKPFWPDMQADSRAGAKQEGISIREPFWVFALLDEQQFWFFHLDEGDDPMVYWYCKYHDGPDGSEYAGVVSTEMTFTQYIDSLVRHYKSGGL